MHASPLSPFADDAAQMPYVVDTEDVKELDEAFADLMCKLTKHSAKPVVIETSAAHFQVLVPKSLRACPMWVVALPDTFAGDVEQFVTFIPTVSEATSVDLLHRWTTLEWESVTHCVCVRAHDFGTGLGQACSDNGQIVVAFVTPSRMAISTLRAHEDLALELKTQGARCDHNYRPMREQGAQKLSAARARASKIGNMPVKHSSGKKPVHPNGATYGLCCSRYW